MNSRGNTLRLTAVSALVVLALTGFSTGRGHGGGSGDGGGGGCSGSGQNHDSSSGSGGGSHGDYDYDDDYGDDAGSGGSGGSGGNASPSLRDATVELLDCASEKAPYATVEVTNPNTVDGVFTVTVVFEDAAGAEVVSRSQDVAVAGDGTETVRVNVDDGGSVARVADCAPGLLAPAAG
ncbi:hypothetical protein GCM10019016_069600 [Streptomyces prasinosporus]|uniref:Secreted protein n=1 Tax=Streptomyces prasinosporus TaxID=68256 RepID=A0ABP6TX01_9ACTN